MTPEPADDAQIVVSFDRVTVDLDALQRAAYAVADLMTVDIAVSGDRYMCTLFPRDSAADAGSLAHRIRSEVIDQALRLRIAAQTEPLRNLIFAVAFSQTGLADAETPPQ
jgi:His-Xaa-Ser system protein HxsD